jgi:hypothetical protein
VREALRTANPSGPALDQPPAETTVPLPWNPTLAAPALEGIAVRASAELRARLAALAPRSITIFREPSAPASDARALALTLRSCLRGELARWAARTERFVRLGLRSTNEARAAVAARSDAHPWTLCVTSAGRLGLFGANAVSSVTLIDYAIAWTPTELPTAAVSYLLTARAPGHPWDENDLGHEYGHASAFPMFGLDGARAAYDTWGRAFVPMDEEAAFRIGVPFLSSAPRAPWRPTWGASRSPRLTGYASPATRRCAPLEPCQPVVAEASAPGAPRRGSSDESARAPRAEAPGGSSGT